MTKIAQIFAFGFVLYAGTAFADVIGGSSSPAPTMSQQKRAAAMMTAETSDITKSLRKRHAHDLTAAAAAETDMTTPRRNKREATTAIETSIASGGLNGGAETMASSTVMSSTSGPRQKRDAVTDGPSTMFTTFRAKNTTPATDASSTARGKREAPNTIPNPTGGPRNKRDACSLSTPAGRRKRQATIDFTATTVRNKREAMTTEIPTTVSTAGRRKRQATTVLMTGSPSGAPKKRSVDITTVASSGTPHDSRNRRGIESTTAPLTEATGSTRLQKRDVPLGMTSPNFMETFTTLLDQMPTDGPNLMVGSNVGFTPGQFDHLGMLGQPPIAGISKQPRQPVRGQVDSSRQRRDAESQPATSSIDESTGGNNNGKEVTQVTSYRHRFPTPQFITDLTPEQRRQFFEIKSNFTLTKNEIHAQLQKWLQQQPDNVQAGYKTFHKNLAKIKNDISQKIQANLSSEGRALFNKIKTYMDDDSLTMRQTCENIQQAMDAVPERVRDELHCDEHMPMPSGGGMPTPRRVDACNEHFIKHVRALVTEVPPVNPQPVLLAATA